MNKKMILSLVDKVVKVDRGGPESRVGMLIQQKMITLLCLQMMMELFIIIHSI